MKKSHLKVLVLASLPMIIASCTKPGQGGGSIAGTSVSEFNPDDYTCGTYSNPVGVFRVNGSDYTNEFPDPTTVRGDDGLFYSVSTNRKMLASEDGCNWEVVTESIIPQPKWGTGDYGVWAPDLVKVGDQWIYYYSLSGWGNPIGIGYATADDIYGPYSDKGKLFTGDEIGIRNCIDPQVFVDDDGEVYLVAGSFQGCWLVELTNDGTGVKNGVNWAKENKTLIAGFDSPGWDGACYEGSYIFKKDGYYYYMGSTGTCCAGQNSTYRVYVGKSEDITGPYVGSENKIPMSMSGNGKTYGNLVIQAPISMNEEVAGPGHNSIIVDDLGEYWIYYHAYSNKDNFSNRHLFMDKLIWDENGYPHTEGYRPSFDEELDGPAIYIGD